MEIYRELIDRAIKAREGAYAPYSKFKVGSAVLTLNNNIYDGCNIENASYTPTVCAERVAIFKAVSKGEKVIKKIAIYGKPETFTFPCGVCRQVINEFCSEDCELIIIKNIKEYKIVKFKDIFPYGFGKEDLND